MPFWTYILKCADGSFYTGHTDNLEKRMAEHQQGSVISYTLKRRPVTLEWSQAFETRVAALAAEQQIKGWTRKKKLALIEGDWAVISAAAKKVF